MNKQHQLQHQEWKFPRILLLIEALRSIFSGSFFESIFVQKSQFDKLLTKPKWFPHKS